MHLKLNELQKLVNATLAEDTAGKELKREIARVLGPVVIVKGKLQEVVAAANDRLDVLDRTGRSKHLDWNPKITSNWIDYANPEIRKFAARVVPQQFLGCMLNDRNSDVRATVASRLSLNGVREMIKRFPNDDQLQSIFRTKKLHEAGISQPDIQDEPFDMYGEPLGDTVKQGKGPELSETWYYTQARRLMSDYGHNIEYAWEEIAVRRICSSIKATSGIDVDEARLLKAVKDLIKEKEERALERDALAETIDWLDKKERSILFEDVELNLLENIDQVRELVEGNLSSQQFVEKACELFSIQNCALPMGIRKYRLGEGNAKSTLVPSVGMLPHESSFRAIDEKALDMFCEHWSRHQQMVGEPLRLEWSAHPGRVGKIGFTCFLR